MFQYALATPAAAKAEVAAAFLALKDVCRRPGGRKYILSIDGGPNISPENAGKGMEVRLQRFTPSFVSSSGFEYALANFGRLGSAARVRGHIQKRGGPGLLPTRRPRARFFQGVAWEQGPRCAHI